VTLVAGFVVAPLPVETAAWAGSAADSEVIDSAAMVRELIVRSLRGLVR
jgi:hypothetical protein